MEKVKLGEVCTLITKGTTPTSVGYKFEETGINFIKIEAISETGELLQDKFSYINEECNNKLKRSKLHENDILFSIAGAIGKVAIVKKDMLPANINQALAIIRIDDKYNKKYLRYILSSEYIKEQYNRKKQGVAQLNLSLNDISELEIPIVDLKEQNKIADNLDKVQKIINKNQEQIKLLEELIKSQFIEMFGDIRNKKYNIEKICDLVDTDIEKLKKKFFRNEIIKYVDISAIDNVKNEIIGYTEYKVGEEPSRAQQRLKKDDILVATVRPNLKNIAVNKFEESNIIGSSGFCVLRPKKCNLEYLLNVVKSNKFTNDMVSVTTGANYPAIRVSDILNYEISVPPIELQNQFAEIVKKIEKQKTKHKKNIETAQELMDKLMDEYFNKRRKYE